MSFWFDLCLSASPTDVFSAPFSFRPGDLPPFYKSLVLPWRELGGAFSASRSSLVFGAADPLFCVPVCTMTTKSCYLFLLSERLADPHCVEKFAPSFGSLYWPTTCGLCLFLTLIAKLSTSTGRSLTVFFILLSAFPLSACQSLSHVFAVPPLRHCLICFLLAPWLKVSWLGFSRLCFLLTRCLLFCLSVIHCLVWILLSCVQLPAFLFKF